MRRAVLAGLIAVLLTAAVPGWARQETPTAQPAISEEDFWARMVQTQILLAKPDLTNAADFLHSWWDGVEAVRVGDTVIQVDMGWIMNTFDPNATPYDESDVPSIRRYVDALVAYHQQQIGSDSAGGDASAEDLRQILADPRFQYGEPTPTPDPLSNVRLPDNMSGFEPVFWIVLIIAAALVIVYILRTLRIQAVSLPPESGDDEPRTAEEAHGRAQDLEAERDYRMAVRYRFLALLLLLDQRGIIHYDRSLTNREHVRQITAQPQIEKLLRSVVNTFDAVWYGFLPLSEAEYRTFTEQIDQLQAAIGGAAIR